VQVQDAPKGRRGPGNYCWFPQVLQVSFTTSHRIPMAVPADFISTGVSRMIETSRAAVLGQALRHVVARHEVGARRPEMPLLGSHDAAAMTLMSGPQIR
jgi:hypothetical protein